MDAAGAVSARAKALVAVYCATPIAVTNPLNEAIPATVMVVVSAAMDVTARSAVLCEFLIVCLNELFESAKHY